MSPSRRATGNLSPRMQGLPVQTAGSIVIRVNAIAGLCRKDRRLASPPVKTCRVDGPAPERLTWPAKSIRTRRPVRPQGGIVTALTRAVLLATAALGAVVSNGQQVFAQGWGPAVAAKDIDPAIRAAAEVMGMVRTRALVIGQVNLPELVGKGTMVDLEATGTAQPVEVSRYTFAIALHLQASRLDFE